MSSKKIISQLLTITISLFIIISGVFHIEFLLLPSKFINRISVPEDFKAFPKMAFNEANYSRYDLSIVFDESTSSVEGNLTVDFYNNDPVNFTEIPFHLYLFGMLNTSRPGEIKILNVSKLGNPNAALLFNISIENHIMWVKLDKTLEAYQRSQFVISFNATIPDSWDRANSYGEDWDHSRIFTFSSFYPLPCVYDKFDGWNTDKYSLEGDPFYYDMAYYNFSIEVPNGMVIVATGKLIEKRYKGLTTVYRFDPIYPVREVTFSASRWFQVESSLINGVNISTYFLPKDTLVWSNFALNCSINAIKLFNESFGPYPYPTLNIVEWYSFFGGMEYPCQVYIAENYARKSNPQPKIEKAIAHEIAHQWWYNLVGNDEVDWGFLDESLASWSQYYYNEKYYPNWNYFQNTSDLDYVRNFHANTGKASKINQSIYEYIASNSSWVHAQYYQAPVILEKLRRIIGNETFISGLKVFFFGYRFKIALLSDLQQSFEQASGKTLDWFFFPWFDNPYIPKYNLSNCLYRVSQNVLTITITDLNEPMNEYKYSQQVPLSVYDSIGNILYNEWIWINSTTIISIPTTTTPYNVCLWYDNDVLVQLESSDVFSIEKTVDIIFPPEPPCNFILTSNAGSPDDDGTFNLYWTESIGAKNYSLYQYSYYITSLNETLTLLAEGLTNLSYSINHYDIGTYYFIAVAHNNSGDTLSNCISVTIGTPSQSNDKIIPGYPTTLIFISIFIIIGTVVVFNKLKKRNLNLKFYS